MARMGLTTQRMIGLGAASAVLVAGAITATQALAATSAPSAQRIGDFFMCADNHTRALQLAWSTTTCPTGTMKFVVPLSSAGAKGPTGATGATGAIGATGPSDLYAGAQADSPVVVNSLSTFDTVDLPAGSYQVQFSATVDRSTAVQDIQCAVFPLSGSAPGLPSLVASLTQGTSTPLSASGWYVTTTDATLALKCLVQGTVDDHATLERLRMSALKVGTIH